MPACLESPNSLLYHLRCICNFCLGNQSLSITILTYFINIFSTADSSNFWMEPQTPLKRWQCAFRLSWINGCQSPGNCFPLPPLEAWAKLPRGKLEPSSSALGSITLDIETLSWRSRTPKSNHYAPVNKMHPFWNSWEILLLLFRGKKKNIENVKNLSTLLENT